MLTAEWPELEERWKAFCRGPTPVATPTPLCAKPIVMEVWEPHTAIAPYAAPALPPPTIAARLGLGGFIADLEEVWFDFESRRKKTNFRRPHLPPPEMEADPDEWFVPFYDAVKAAEKVLESLKPGRPRRATELEIGFGKDADEFYGQLLRGLTGTLNLLRRQRQGGRIPEPLLPAPEMERWWELEQRWARFEQRTQRQQPSIAPRVARPLIMNTWDAAEARWRKFTRQENPPWPPLAPGYYEGLIPKDPKNLSEKEFKVFEKPPRKFPWQPLGKTLDLGPEAWPAANAKASRKVRGGPMIVGSWFVAERKKPGVVTDPVTGREYWSEHRKVQDLTQQTWVELVDAAEGDLSKAKTYAKAQTHWKTERIYPSRPASRKSRQRTGERTVLEARRASEEHKEGFQGLEVTDGWKRPWFISREEYAKQITSAFADLLAEEDLSCPAGNPDRRAKISKAK